jgi:hypothetical protein
LLLIHLAQFIDLFVDPPIVLTLRIYDSVAVAGDLVGHARVVDVTGGNGRNLRSDKGSEHDCRFLVLLNSSPGEVKGRSPMVAITATVRPTKNTKRIAIKVVCRLWAIQFYAVFVLDS